MKFNSISYFLTHVFYFNMFEKFFYFFKINNENELCFSFLNAKIFFFLDPLGKHSCLSSINSFLLSRLFFSYSKWEKVLYVRKLNRLVSKRRRFLSKISKYMFIGSTFLINNNKFFNYLENLSRYSLPYYILNSKNSVYNITEFFYFKKKFLFDIRFNFWIPRILFHLGNEPFFESFFFFFESSFGGLKIEFNFYCNNFFFQKILLSHIGLPIN